MPSSCACDGRLCLAVPGCSGDCSQQTGQAGNICKCCKYGGSKTTRGRARSKADLKFDQERVQAGGGGDGNELGDSATSTWNGYMMSSATHAHWGLFGDAFAVPKNYKMQNILKSHHVCIIRLWINLASESKVLCDIVQIRKSLEMFSAAGYSQSIYTLGDVSLGCRIRNVQVKKLPLGITLEYVQTLAQVCAVQIIKDIVSVRLMNKLPSSPEKRNIFLDFDYLPGAVGISEHKPDFLETGYLFTAEWNREPHAAFSRKSVMVNCGCFGIPAGDEKFAKLADDMENHWKKVLVGHKEGKKLQILKGKLSWNNNMKNQAMLSELVNKDYRQHRMEYFVCMGGHSYHGKYWDEFSLATRNCNSSFVNFFASQDSMPMTTRHAIFHVQDGLLRCCGGLDATPCALVAGKVLEKSDVIPRPKSMPWPKSAFPSWHNDPSRPPKRASSPSSSSFARTMRSKKRLRC